VFGRNYDYGFGDGAVLVNPRGMEKRSLVESSPAHWTARFGSLTFNQYGRDNPMGGVNERGLVVELMWLDETKYPAPDSRPAVATLEYIQYLLDNYATVEEALEGSKRIRIGTRTPLHYLIADKAGDVATIEFLAGRRVVHRGETLPHPVLANSTYEDSLGHLKGRIAKGAAGPDFTSGSLDRFAKAAQRVAALEATKAKELVEHSFGILDEVKQGSHTRWQIVYDLPRNTVHWRTHANGARRAIRLDALDFTCGSGARLLDIDQGRGDLTAALDTYTPQANERMMLTAFAKSPQFGWTPEMARAEAHRIETTRRCTRTG
jgi:hypothetical protein